LKARLYELILNIWNKETIPCEWLESIIYPICKKGDCKLCSSYRSITLLNAAYKIFTFLLNNRFSEVEPKIRDYQTGFRPSRSTIDICMIWQIYEKCHEHNIEVHNLFIDFKQAFDFVIRALIPNCLKLFNVPSKVIKLILH
jgi:sorting nexin-29